MAQIRSRVLTVIDARTRHVRYLADLPGQVEQGRQMQLWGGRVLLPVIRRTSSGYQEDLALVSLHSGRTTWLTDTPDASEIAAAPVSGGMYVAVAKGDQPAGTLTQGWIEYVPDHGPPERVLNGVVADRLYALGSMLLIAGRADASPYGEYGIWETTIGHVASSADEVLQGPYRWPAPEPGTESMLVTRLSDDPGGTSSLIRMALPGGA
jgi:hypothetical protein